MRARPPDTRGSGGRATIKDIHLGFSRSSSRFAGVALTLSRDTSRRRCALPPSGSLGTCSFAPAGDLTARTETRMDSSERCSAPAAECGMIGSCPSPPLPDHAHRHTQARMQRDRQTPSRCSCVTRSLRSSLFRCNTARCFRLASRHFVRSSRSSTAP